MTNTIQLNCPRCGAVRTIYFDHVHGQVYPQCPKGCEGNGTQAVGIHKP
jgi:endogenous inhibitor of DNA gyrase (YacG/DUF329 family)